MSLTSNSASTLVLQSHRLPLPHSWLETALSSVKAWSERCGFDYRFIDDELFEVLNAQERTLCRSQPVVASDLARLRWCQNLLSSGVGRVVWCDADTLVFDPQALQLSSAGCAFGRELWLQETEARETNRSPTLKTYKKIHNAFMQFEAGNPVLDFYAFAAERLIKNHRAHSDEPMVAQLAGPKFLTHLHNVVSFDVVEAAQVMSPPLANAWLSDDHRVLDAYTKRCEVAPAAFNLCCSEIHRNSISETQIFDLIDRLNRHPG